MGRRPHIGDMQSRAEALDIKSVTSHYSTQERKVDAQPKSDESLQNTNATHHNTTNAWSTPHI